ncbi:hypothetical protein Tco_0597433 [Tanacetum coccineum]
MVLESWLCWLHMALHMYCSVWFCLASDIVWLVLSACICLLYVVFSESAVCCLNLLFGYCLPESAAALSAVCLICSRSSPCGILQRLEALVASPIGCGGSDVGIAE